MFAGWSASGDLVQFPCHRRCDPGDEAATQLIRPAIRSFEKDVRQWFAARKPFAIMFGEHFAA